MARPNCHHKHSDGSLRHLEASIAMWLHPHVVPQSFRTAPEYARGIMEVRSILYTVMQVGREFGMYTAKGNWKPLPHYQDAVDACTREMAALGIDLTRNGTRLTLTHTASGDQLRLGGRQDHAILD